MSTINQKQIINLAKDYLDNDELNDSEFYLYLYFLTDIEDIPTYLAANAYLSYIYVKTNKEFNLELLAINCESKKDLILDNSDSAYFLIRACYRTSNYLAKNGSYFKSYHYSNLCKYLFEKTYLKKTNSQSFQCVLDLNTSIYKNILQYVENTNNLFTEDANNNNIIYNKIKSIMNKINTKNYIDNLINKSTYLTPSEDFDITKETNNTLDSKDNTDIKSNTIFYLMSAKSIETINHFLNNNNISHTSLYRVEDTLKIYYNNDPSFLGLFPGPIDNSDLITNKLSYDLFIVDYLEKAKNNNKLKNLSVFKNIKLDSYLNSNNIDLYKVILKDDIRFKFYANSIFLKNGLEENVNFTYVGESDYMFLKKIFGSNIDIPREYNFEKDLIDLNYKCFEVIFICKTLRIKRKHLLCSQSLQISRHLNIKDLVIKLKYIYLAMLEYNVYDIDFNLKEKQELINEKLKINVKCLQSSKVSKFELLFTFNNNLKQFVVNEGIEYSEFTTNDDIKNKIYSLRSISNKSIDDFEYCPEEDFLVVEIDNENFVKIKSKYEKLSCSFCKENLIEINKNKISNCKNCSHNIYCSNKCLLSDKAHIEFHKNLGKYYKSSFSLDEILKTPISEILDINKSIGRTGLRNLGNTCFMNSAIQCLSHCEDLTKYFLLNYYEQDINATNKLGSGGNVARAYYELIEELWNGNSRYLSPSDFRHIFVRFARQFSGYSQHDSQEMLTFVLDALHEDLNRIRTKPYISMDEQQPNETEKEASDRWWKNHTLRENSIIVDLFHGQYKSIISCPECKRQSLSYDSFMYLSLPIQSELIKISLKVLNFNNSNRSKNSNIDIDNKHIFSITKKDIYINENSCVKDLTSKFDNETNIVEAIVVNYSSKAFKRTLRDVEKLSNIISKDNEIVIYLYNYKDISSVNDLNNDKMQTKSSFYTIYFNLVKIFDEKNFISTNRITDIVDYPYFIVIDILNDNLSHIYIKLYELLHPLINNNLSNNASIRNVKNNNILNIKNNNSFLPNINELSDLFNIFIVNNLPETSGLFSSSKSQCEFCKDKCNYCYFKIINRNSDSFGLSTLNKNKKKINNNIISFDPSKKFVDFLKDNVNPKREKIVLLIQLNNTNKYFNTYFPKPYMSDVCRNQISKNSDINLHDCLELFRNEEKLDKDNTWYCNKCKKHQEATIKMQVFRAPIYLIIHFKRFKIKSNSSIVGFINNKKNDTLVNYPLDLDISNYVIKDPEKAKYELVGVSQHFGGLSSGHYTALCKNNNIWLEFDDESVSKANPNKIVNNSAYLLFYRLKI